MSLSISTIRARVAAGIDAIPDWHISRWAGPNLGLETADRLHRCALVEVPTTELSTSRQRPRRSEGAWVESRVVVHWAWRLRGDAQLTDYDAAADAEELLIAAVLGISASDLTIRWVSSERPVQEPDSDWLVGHLTFRAQHMMALE